MHTTSLRVLLLEDNPINARVVEEMLRHSESYAFQVQRAEDLVAALDLLARDNFDVALVDLMLPDSEGLETYLTVQRHSPRLPIVVLSGLENKALAISAVEKGAQDYLTKGNLNTEALVHAISYAVARSQSSPGQNFAAQESAVITGILGSKGGVGTTTIACHFAAQLKRQTAKDVLLIDLNPGSASASFYMKGECEYTVQDAAMNLQRLDAELWKGLVIATHGGVDLLSSPSSVTAASPFSGERVRHVIRFAASLYGYIVLDLGRLNPAILPILEEVQDLFAVTTMELPALFESSRLLKQLMNLSIGRERLHLIVNRQSKHQATFDTDLERAFGFPSYATVTDHSEELAEAFGAGKYLDGQPRMNKEVAALTSKWLGLETGHTPNRSVSELVSRFISTVSPNRGKGQLSTVLP